MTATGTSSLDDSVCSVNSDDSFDSTRNDKIYSVNSASSFKTTGIKNKTHSVNSNNNLETSENDKAKDVAVQGVKLLHVASESPLKPFCRNVRIEVHEEETRDKTENRGESAKCIDADFNSDGHVKCTDDDMLSYDDSGLTVVNKNQMVISHIKSGENETCNKGNEELTQQPKANFDILDDDFDDILRTQSDGLLDEKNTHADLNDTDVLLGDISLVGELVPQNDSEKSKGPCMVDDECVTELTTDSAQQPDSNDGKDNVVNWSKGNTCITCMPFLFLSFQRFEILFGNVVTFLLNSSTKVVFL